MVFDSPCKTILELQRALELGVLINCDSLEEVDRVIELIATPQHKDTKSVIGLRVNPLLGLGTIKALSVSDSTSKFGIPLTNENRALILRLFKKYSFLTGLHVHVGSQGCSLEMLANGALKICELAEEIGPQVTTLDIGGGLPVNFSSDVTTPTFEDYARTLKRMVPSMFAKSSNPEKRYITEFGRAIQAKIGFVASLVETVKVSGGRRIAIIHAGSDMFVRMCYAPAQFALRVEVYCGAAQNFKLKTQEEFELMETDVVGPLCFGGDKICEKQMLPRIEQGDVVVIRDAGANCLSLYSRHCSRQSPAVWGYEMENGVPKFEQLRAQESVQDVLRFWG